MSGHECWWVDVTTFDDNQRVYVCTVLGHPGDPVRRVPDQA